MKHKYVSKRYWCSEKNAMGQSDIIAKTYDDVINLSLGDPDINTPKPIIDAAMADAYLGHTKYTDFQGDLELIDEVCRFYKEDYGIGVDKGQVFVCSSATVGMHVVLESILDEGDEVILQAPYFTPYPQQVKLSRGVPIELPTYEEEDFQINADRLESLITGHTKALVINTPSNPTGSCLLPETMMKIAEIVNRHDLLVIADDIYPDYSYECPFVPFAGLPGMWERTITLNSFSKGFNMTGWRVGYIVAPEYLIEVFKAVNENVCLRRHQFLREAQFMRLLTGNNFSLLWSANTAAGFIMRQRELIKFLACMCYIRPRGRFTCFQALKIQEKHQKQ